MLPQAGPAGPLRAVTCGTGRERERGREGVREREREGGEGDEGRPEAAAEGGLDCRHHGPVTVCWQHAVRWKVRMCQARGEWLFECSPDADSSDV